MPACPECKADTCASCGAVKLGGSEMLCIALGLAFLAVGLWFLVANPSESGEVVNLQRLTIGETSSIAGPSS